MRQAIGLRFESRRAQKIFSVRDILSRFYHPGQKSLELLSRQPNPGSKTGTNSPLEPGQMALSVVVAGSLCDTSEGSLVFSHYQITQKPVSLLAR